jgi:hypothetical protein
MTLGNIGPGTITGVGLWSLPDGVMPTGAVASISGWNNGGTNDINGVVPDNITRYAVGTTHGINDGLTASGAYPGNQATFTFTFGNSTGAEVLALANSIGVGIHSQGVGSCSTKLYLTANGVQNPDAPGVTSATALASPSRAPWPSSQREWLAWPSSLAVVETALRSSTKTETM